MFRGSKPWCFGRIFDPDEGFDRISAEVANIGNSISMNQRFSSAKSGHFLGVSHPKSVISALSRVGFSTFRFLPTEAQRCHEDAFNCVGMAVEFMNRCVVQPFLAIPEKDQQITIKKQDIIFFVLPFWSPKRTSIPLGSAAVDFFGAAPMLRTHELVVSSCLGWKLDPTGDPGDLSSGGWRSQGDELNSSVLEEIY